MASSLWDRRDVSSSESSLEEALILLINASADPISAKAVLMRRLGIHYSFIL